MKEQIIVFIIVIAVAIGVVGQLLVKIGLNIVGSLDFSSGVIRAYLKIFSSPYVLAGSLIYCFSIFFWLYALSRVDLSFAYPFLALSYVLIMLCSWLFLGETIPAIRIVGVVVICLGVLLVARS